MVTSYTKRSGLYDPAFSESMAGLRRARESAESRPLDYSRLGGAAFLRRGEMYGTLYDAAAQAASRRRMAEQARDQAWAEAGARKEALAMRQQAQNISGLVSGLGGLGQDFVRRGAQIGRRELSQTELGDEFQGLRDEGLIREPVEGSGVYRYTPRGVMGELHRGPYWWETPGSTGGAL